MNKISLKNLNLKEVEQLSREQLKNVLGGFTGGAGGTGTDEGTTESPCHRPECDAEDECEVASNCGFLGEYTCDSVTVECCEGSHSYKVCRAVLREA